VREICITDIRAVDVEAMAKFSTGRSGKVIDLRRWRARDAARVHARVSRTVLSQNRKSPLRARRRKLQALAVFILAVLVVGAVKGLSSLSYLPQFTINSISITGTNDVPQKLVRAYVEAKLYDGSYPLLSRDNIFLYPRDDISKSVTSYFPRIRSADISRSSLLAQAIRITIVERQPFARWCSLEEECYLMDDSGFIFAPSSTTTPGASMVFRGGLQLDGSDGTAKSPVGQTFLPGHLSDILELFKRLRQAGYAPNGVSVIDEQDFSVSFSEGFALRASLENDAGALVRNLQLALSADPILGKVDELDYIDMRFGNRVYYKFKK